MRIDSNIEAVGPRHCWIKSGGYHVAPHQEHLRIRSRSRVCGRHSNDHADDERDDGTGTGTTI
ncbi:MAG: hypothetical protein ACYCU5_03920 [Actinomycetes bacterium]